MARIFMMVLLGSVGFLVLSVWPGLLDSAVVDLFLFTPLLVPGLLLAVLYFVIHDQATPAARWRWGFLAVSVLIVAVGMMRYHLPRRVALAFCVSGLFNHVDGAPVSDGGYQGFPLDRGFGPYWVDRYAADVRGGVYYRTSTGPAGLGPDLMSYGFAFRPNSKGSPFGVAHYRIQHLFGEWYAFEASNDW